MTNFAAVLLCFLHFTLDEGCFVLPRNVSIVQATRHHLSKFLDLHKNVGPMKALCYIVCIAIPKTLGMPHAQELHRSSL